MFDLSQYMNQYHIETLETIVCILIIFAVLGLAGQQR